MAYTLQYYERVIVETPKYIVNSFLYSGIAVALCIAVGVPIAWLLGRSTVPGRGALDALNTLILAIPGTAIGIAYIRAFHFDLPGLDRGLTSFWIIMPLVLAVRRLPYTVRGSYASLLLVHRSMEEAAASVGATELRSFRDITLPLIWKGVLVGSLFSFMTSLQEASAVLFLALGGWESITNGIFAFYIAGSANEAAALGVILIVVAAVSTILINRIAGTRMGGRVRLMKGVATLDHGAVFVPHRHRAVDTESNRIKWFGVLVPAQIAVIVFVFTWTPPE